ncbi:MAG: hypothetical protein ACMUIE_04535 [Thermoplasmatota archaeon]
MKGRIKVRDPMPGYGGKRPKPHTAVLLVISLLAAGSFFWYAGMGDGGYKEVKSLAEVKCLGCLGLDPVVPPFENFWTNYPEDHKDRGKPVDHPEEVHDILDSGDYDILILFFWGPGCEPCKKQWEEMVEEGIASGPEEGGREGDRYSDLRLISVDNTNDKVGYYGTYIPTGIEDGVPMTTFLFKTHNGTVYWYSHYGRMKIQDVEELIEEIVEYLEKERLMHHYDDISSVDDRDD